MESGIFKWYIFKSSRFIDEQFCEILHTYVTLMKSTVTITFNTTQLICKCVKNAYILKGFLEHIKINGEIKVFD